MDAGDAAELGMGWNDDGSMKGRKPPLGSEPAQKRMRSSMAGDHAYDYGFGGDQCDQSLAAEPAKPPVVDGFFSTGLPQAQSYGHMETGQAFNGWQGAQGRGRGSGNLLHKTKLCTRYQAGSCSFNTNCNFAHGLEELRKPPVPWEATAGGFGRGWTGPMQRPYKTKPCRFFLAGGCPYGDRCTFLHDEQGDSGIRPQSLGSVGWKTRLCSRWERGEICGFGENCHFAHGPAELQSNGGESLQTGSGAVQPLDFNPMNEFSAAYRDTTMPGTMPGIMPASASYGSEVLHQDSSWAYNGVSLSTEASTQNVKFYEEPSAPGVVDDFSPNYDYKPMPNGWEKSGQAFEQKPDSNPVYNQPAEQPDYAPYCQDRLQIYGSMPFTGDNGHHYLPDTTLGSVEAENLNNYAEGPRQGD